MLQAAVSLPLIYLPIQSPFMAGSQKTFRIMLMYAPASWLSFTLLTMFHYLLFKYCNVFVCLRNVVRLLCNVMAAAVAMAVICF